MWEFPDYVLDVLSQLKRDPSVESVWFIGSRANGLAKPESDWDFLVFCDTDPEFVPERHPGVDVIRIGPSGAGLLEGSPHRLSFSNWNWRPSEDGTASYTGTKFIDYGDRVRDTSEPMTISRELQGYRVWAKVEP